MKKILLSVVVAFSVVSLQAQFTYDYLRAADDYFRKADYYSAAQYYEKYLGIAKAKLKTDEYNPYTAVQKTAAGKKTTVAVSSRQQAIYNLAESYRLLNYPAKAEPYYAQAAEFDKNQFPLVRYWYATVLRALEKYEEAEKQLTAFLDEYKVYKVGDKYPEAAAKEIENLRFIQVQLKKKDIALYTVVKTSAADTGAFYAPVWLDNSTILFTSTKADNSAPKNEVYTNRVYQASYSEGVLGNINKISLPQVKDVHQGVVTITPGGNTMFLTRWTIANGSKTSSIYTSTRTGDKWSDPVLVDPVVNVPGFNTQQPFIMPDGKHLIFASDKAGGFGGFDLYYADIDAAGTISNVTNMGAAINTKFDEQAPYYHSPSGTLVFSSNGRVGMGGYDFFFSKGTLTNWATPQNFGYPVNSVKDDIYFASRGMKNILDEVLISSDRAAACCLEIFSLKKARMPKVITGKVVACADGTPLIGATVNIVDTINNKTITTKTTDMQGMYTFTIDDFQPLKAVALSDSFYSSSIKFNAPGDPEAERMTNPDICLIPIEFEKPVIVNNVYYDFDKADLKPESFPELDKLVNMLNANPNMTIELSAHTDSKGSHEYNQRLSDARAKSVVDYLVSKGIDRRRLIARGYAATMPIAPNTNDDGSDNPEGRAKNRRTEFKVLKN